MNSRGKLEVLQARRQERETLKEKTWDVIHQMENSHADIHSLFGQIIEVFV